MRGLGLVACLFHIRDITTHLLVTICVIFKHSYNLQSISQKFCQNFPNSVSNLANFVAKLGRSEIHISQAGFVNKTTDWSLKKGSQSNA